MTTTSVRTRRWKRVEYEQLIEKGIFQPGERLELVAGELVVREPQGTPHITAIRMVEEALREAFGAGWEVRSQAPVALDEDSEPEPDVTVARGTLWDYRYAHPSEPALLVEVAEASLDFDRRHKGSLYARARAPEYWIVNLVERVLDVYGEPVLAPEAHYGWRYRAVTTLQGRDFIAPLAAPHTRIAVADLLP